MALGLSEERMPPAEVDDMLSRIDSLLDWEGLTDWEFDFLSDMQERLQRYGPTTRISERQEETLIKVERRYFDE